MDRTSPMSLALSAHLFDFKLVTNMAINIYDVVGNWVASPPIIYQELQKVMDDPDASFQDFGTIIASDPSLASQLLKVANSAYYGLVSKVETLSHALTVVGLAQLADMAFAAVMVQQFQGIPKKLLDIDAFWKHSITCGVAARSIARRIHDPEAEKYYLAGMFHDLGTLVVCKSNPEEAEKSFQLAKDKGISLAKAEVEVLGFDHTAMAGILLKGWNLPDILVEAVSFHHSPRLAKKFPQITAAVHVADILAHDMELGNSGEPKIPELVPSTLKTLELDKQYIDELKESIQEQVDEIFPSLSADTS